PPAKVRPHLWRERHRCVPTQMRSLPRWPARHTVLMFGGVEDRMNEKFSKVVESLQPKLDELLRMAPIQAAPLPAGIPLGGIYLLSEGEKHLYVGRSESMPTRLRNHCNGSHKQAAFAFKIAREATGLTNPTYKRA